VTKRPTSTLAKLGRMRKALRHEEPHRVPVSDFFRGGFVQRRAEVGATCSFTLPRNTPAQPSRSAQRQCHEIVRHASPKRVL
jgi:hypothetical protein